MTLSSIYLVCFLFGVLMSALAFLSGAVHFDFLPKFHGHGLFDFHGHAGHVHVPHATSDVARAASLNHLSFFNFGALMAFLAWFGGSGFLLTRYSGVGSVVALALALIAGVVGASLINFFLVKVLIGRERALEHTEIAGTIGVLTIPLRESGTAEIVYSQHGTRRSAAARTEDGASLPRGSEVVITRYENGIAYVTPLERVLDRPTGH